jgi:hypothetical protein
MKPRTLFLLTALALAALILHVATRPEDPPSLAVSGNAPAAPAPAPTPPEATTTPPPAANAAPATPLPPTARPTVRSELGNPLAPASFPEPAPPSGEDSQLAIDLEKITLMLRDYRTLTGENPVGTNAEIMKALMGGNPKGALLGPPEGLSLNAAGEIIDRWGSPFFFHQLTSRLTEIRSAGPDRKLWTRDDLLSR